VVAKGIQFLTAYNSSVGLANLGLYRRNHVLPLCMTSGEETAAFGGTGQASERGCKLAASLARGSSE
jgi:hypothetical protein